MKYTLFLFLINNLVYSVYSYTYQNKHTQKKNIIPSTTIITNTIIPSPTNQGKATFYFRVGNDQNGCPNVQTFNDNNRYGPCNNGQGVQYNLNSVYWVAISNAQQHCGKKIRVNYKNNSLDLTVMDECPGCGNNVDMSLDALIELTGSKEIACAIDQPLPEITWNLL